MFAKKSGLTSCTLDSSTVLLRRKLRDCSADLCFLLNLFLVNVKKDEYTYWDFPKIIVQLLCSVRHVSEIYMTLIFLHLWIQHKNVLK